VLLEIARRSPDERDLDIAIDALADRDRLDPHNPRTQQSYGIALALSGETDQAIVELKHAALLDPNSIDTLLNLATVQLEDGRIDDGSATLDLLGLLAPTNARAQELRREFLT
jgi:cytochrome c-type biogenesis protein CcmH/NrfG